MVRYIAWTRRDRALRRAAMEKVVLETLADRHPQQEQHRWLKAFSPARRADGLRSPASEKTLVGDASQKRREPRKAAGEFAPPSTTLTGPASPRRSVCAPAGMSLSF